MKTTLSPPNSIIFLFDQTNKAVVPPEYNASRVVSSNNNCVSIGTRSEFDGETTVELNSYQGGRFDPELIWFHDIKIATPGGIVSVVTSHNDALLTVSSGTRATRLAIGLNDPSEPDIIVIRIVSEGISDGLR